MKSLTVESQRDDARQGRFNITVKPTPSKPRAVTVDFNDHIDIKDDEIYVTTGKACKVIEEDWEKSIDRSLTVANGLILDALQVNNK